MPYMWEHINAGIYASVAVCILPVVGVVRGFIPTSYDLCRSLTAFIAITIGSDLPDIDAKRAPISRMFQILVPATVTIGLLWIGLWPPMGLSVGGTLRKMHCLVGCLATEPAQITGSTPVGVVPPFQLFSTEKEGHP